MLLLVMAICAGLSLFLCWFVIVPPFKVTNKNTEIWWSKSVESMRKDGECAFEILKG